MSTSMVAGHRQLAAPCQQAGSAPEFSGQTLRVKHGGNGSNNNGQQGLTLEDPNAVATQNYPDYRTYQFQALEPVMQVAFDKYCGPTPESNWVVPGKLLVGAYPASADDAETLDLITSILQNRITKFVCLQQEVSYFDKLSLNISFCTHIE